MPVLLNGIAPIIYQSRKTSVRDRNTKRCTSKCEILFENRGWRLQSTFVQNVLYSQLKKNTSIYLSDQLKI